MQVGAKILTLKNMGKNGIDVDRQSSWNKLIINEKWRGGGSPRGFVEVKGLDVNIIKIKVLFSRAESS